MSDYSTYTVGQLLSDIKIESRNNGNTELDDYIVGCINVVLKDYTALNKQPQLFVKDQSLTLTAATSSVALPSDLQHIDRFNIRYLCAGDVCGRILVKYDKYRSIRSGPTCQFIRVNNNLLVTPYTNILTGDTLLIDYWTLPPILQVTDIFPMPTLINVIRNAVCAKVVPFDDPKQYARFKSEEKQSYIASQAVQN